MLTRLVSSDARTLPVRARGIGIALLVHAGVIASLASHPPAAAPALVDPGFLVGPYVEIRSPSEIAGTTPGGSPERAERPARPSESTSESASLSTPDQATAGLPEVELGSEPSAVPGGAIELMGGAHGTTVLAGAGETRGSTFVVEDIGVRPVLSNADEVRRLLSRLYPPRLAEAGIEGQVVFRFVIREDGTVEPGSVEIVRATHESFSVPSIAVAERLRFRPILFRGAAVRVQATLPVTWRLAG